MFDGLWFESFHFLRPWWGLLAAPILAAWLFYQRNQQQAPSKVSYFDAHLLKVLTLPAKKYRFFSPQYLLVASIIVLLITLMGPSWSRQPSPFEEDKAALYIALDVSESMNSRDIQPSRLQRAKQKIHDLLTIREGGQTGLIVYSGSAHTVLPLTNDAQIIDSYLASINSEVIPKAGKFPETILPLLSGVNSGSTSVLVISDGIGSQSTSEFESFFKNNNYQLLVLGIGLTADELAQKQIEDIAAIDESGLKNLASASQGNYIASTIKNQDVKTIVKHLDRFMQATADYQAPWHDASYPLVFVLMLVALPWFRKGLVLNSLLIIFCMTPLSHPKAHAADFADLWLTPDQQGRYYFERGDYHKAATAFEDIHWKASAYYMAEEFDLAAQYFSRIDSPQARFSKANAYAHAGRYLKAIATYKEVLTQSPEHTAAQTNQQIVQNIVDEINRLSASQQDSPDDKFRIDELKGATDKAQGADREVFETPQRQQYSAQQLLNDKALNEQWLRSVQANPSQFLSAKFYLQWQKQAETESP